MEKHDRPEDASPNPQKNKALQKTHQAPATNINRLKLVREMFLFIVRTT
jgi:hypothetical protein